MPSQSRNKWCCLSRETVDDKLAPTLPKLCCVALLPLPALSGTGMSGLPAPASRLYKHEVCHRTVCVNSILASPADKASASGLPAYTRSSIISLAGWHIWTACITCFSTEALPSSGIGVGLLASCLLCCFAALSSTGMSELLAEPK